MRLRDFARILILFLITMAAASVLVIVAYVVLELTLPGLRLPPLFEAIGLVFSGLALVALIYSISVQTRSIQAETNASVAARQLEIDAMFVEKPWLRPYFLERKTIGPDSDGYQECLAAMMLFANYLDTYFIQKGEQSQLWGDGEWRAYIDTHLASAPMLRQWIIENPALYSATLRKLAETASRDNA